MTTLLSSLLQDCNKDMAAVTLQDMNDMAAVTLQDMNDEHNEHCDPEYCPQKQNKKRKRYQMTSYDPIDDSFVDSQYRNIKRRRLNPAV